ncbi:Peptidyl-tRNA hydrolase protein 2, mitochondrial [Physocladia obscura]|uniref:peptidyl-tRNA hydrolase n=1 Tax=Physocladia obscura TaxID=109957 RepID=A0AAD5TCV8_9FUNG|nr:Peptidyl-tRNA hydrolase protein 2, mitochondrial [Physocladia obscura]
MTEDECVQALIQLGFDEARVRLAYRQLGGANESLDAVAETAMLLSDAEAGAEAAGLARSASQAFKLVLVVNTRLAMGAGKVAAQASHAALGAVIGRAGNPEIDAWRNQGEPIVVLASDSDSLPDADASLSALEIRARDAGLPVFQVFDAGRTEVAAGSNTVLAIGPAVASRIDLITLSTEFLREMDGELLKPPFLKNRAFGAQISLIASLLSSFDFLNSSCFNLSVVKSGAEIGNILSIWSGAGVVELRTLLTCTGLDTKDDNPEFAFDKITGEFSPDKIVSSFSEYCTVIIGSFETSTVRQV